MKKLFCSIVLAGMLAMPGAANAASLDSGDSFSATVRYGDLDLSTAGGRATFQGRIKAAANRACGIVPVRPFDQIQLISSCRSQFERAAETQIALALAPNSGRAAGTR